MPRELREMMMAAAPATAALAPYSSPAGPRLITSILKDPDTKVITLLVAWFLLRKLQLIVGPRRRRSGSWLVQCGAMAAYFLPTALLILAANTVYSSSTSPNKARFGNLCTAFLVWSAYGPIVVMTAYTLRTGPFQRWRLLPYLVYLLWMQYDFFFKGRTTLEVKTLAYFILGYVFPVLVALRMSLSVSPVAKLERETKAFADYMPLLVLKLRSSSSLFVHGRLDDDNSLQQGCEEYPFKYDQDTWFTVKDLPTQDQDTFFSYSLCRLLARRYFKFTCVEQGDAEVRNLVLAQLLSDYKRAFSLVEVQLAFLHDHFFTDYPAKIDTTSLGRSIASLICYGLLGLSAPLVLVYYPYGLHYVVRAFRGAMVLVVVILVVLLLETLPMFYPILLPNYWHPVRQLIKGYPTAASGTVAVDSSTPASGQCSCYYWRNKMGQYSLLADYDHSSLNKACIIDWFKQRLLPHASPGFIKHHPTPEDDVRVPDSVRRLVALTLQRHIRGPPTKGMTSLWRNRDLLPEGDLSWTCERLECHTQIIMLWHIATCYCDMFPAVAAGNHHEVATALSKYCACLVAFLPQFLPDHRLTSVTILENVLLSAKGILGPTGQQISMEEKLSRLQGLELPEDCPNLTDTAGNTTFVKGIYLGRQLMELDDASVRWMLMAEFWAETILYVTPSDDAAAHVEQLAKGGEFVTHLWAMLSNAGIMHRAADDPSPPPPQQHGGVQA